MTRKMILTVLLLVIATALFAQRDSLCMRLVDEWFEADSAALRIRSIANYGEFIYAPCTDGLRIYSLSDGGLVSLDTTVINRYRGINYFDILDSLGLANSGDDLILLNLADSPRPDSIYTYSGIFESEFGCWFDAEDTIIFSESSSLIQRFNMSDPLSVTEIPTYCDTLSNYLSGLEYIDFPYGYLWTDSRHTEDISLYNCDLSVTDSILFTCLGIIPRSYIEQEPAQIIVSDTIIYISYYYGALRTFKTSSTRDTLILLDTYEEYVDSYGGTLTLMDTLLLVPWGEYLKIFNIVDPNNVELIAYYYETGSSFESAILIDSFLVAASTYSIKIFEYPCTTCDGNCELDREMPDDLNIDIYPNPFNAVCQIKLPNFDESSQLCIFDIKGHIVVKEEIDSDTKSYVWNASHLPSGIYLIKFSNSNCQINRKALLAK